MNKKTLMIGAGLVFACGMLFTACKKKDDDSATNSTKIIATWTKSYDAIDSNNNNVIDASEKTFVTAPDFESVTFTSAGTFTDSVAGFGSFTGTYSVNGDYVTVNLLGQTNAGKITQLDANNFIISDTSSHPTNWTAYIK